MATKKKKPRSRKSSANPAKKAKSGARKTTKKRVPKPVTRPANPGLTPRKRLNAVFAELNACGIVALQNAGYTVSDGWSDVNERASALAAGGNRPRGGTFYHGQDRERARRGEGLFLAYDSYSTKKGKQRDQDALAIGHEIVEVLRRHGFTPKWNGSFAQRIHTGRFEWK